MRAYGKPIVAIAVALLVLCVSGPLALAQENPAVEDPQEVDELETLFAQLEEADAASSGTIVATITRIWSHSGSASMDLLLERGKQALGKDDYQVAVEHFSAAIDHAPDFAEAYNGRAAAFFQMREFGLAVADIQQVLVLNPQHFGALEGLGQILLELGDHQNALIAFRQALALYPSRDVLIDAVARLEEELQGTAL